MPFYLFIHLLVASDAPGLRCCMYAVCVLRVRIHTEAVCTQHTGPSAASGIQFPDQGLNSGPLHWQSGILATGSPEMPPK